MGRIQLIAILFNISLLVFVIVLIRRGNLKEKYALSWLCGFSVLLVLSISRTLLEKAAFFFGVFYPPSFMFLLAIFVVLVILLHFSIAISALEKKFNALAQRLALLDSKSKGASSSQQ